MRNKSLITVTISDFSGLLTIALIVLKLVGVIGWHWGWVLSPLWISIAIQVLLLIVYLILTKIWG